jgi:3-hydroxy-9,10-secoandrosta-1,3,5(10)-triene-9,17-dione monooxygenase
MLKIGNSRGGKAMSGDRPAIRVVSGKQAVSADELIARARALAPKLKERAAEAASLRRCPDQTLADPGKSGLTRVCQPLRFGGYELGWDVLCEVSQILAAACGAQGWVQRIFADHAHMLATFPAAAQEDVWGKDHGVFVSASFDPTGRARRVEGGFQFSGRHGFSSGIDHAGWMICGGFIEEDARREGPHFFLVPKSDATVIDDWHVMGLEGTGSKSFEVQDKFIPAHRFLDGRLARAGNGPGTEINTAPLYRLPKGGGLTSTGFAALAVGMAKGLLEDWLDYTGPRKSRGVAIGSQQSMQMLAAEAAAEIDAAEALYMSSIAAAMKKLARGETIGAMELAAAKRNVAFTCQLVLQAGTKLFNAAGGRALFTESAMQRKYRNLLGAVSHHGVVWDQAATEYGKALLQQHGAPRSERADVD